MTYLLLALLLDLADLSAMVWQESGGRPWKVSDKGCCGLMQVSPRALGTWLGRRWTCEDLKNPWLGLGAGITMRQRWQERSARAGMPECWRAGYRGGNRRFRECVRNGP